jgi:phosphoenolpyruvate phosphomutase|tara:strand:- start:571 stop:1464 length:894 start_codon:yes stop_codon:yes gene_type:complete
VSNLNNLRNKLKEQPILTVGGAFDAMSAKLVELSGFDAIWAGSFAISATHALPDASILTMTEFLGVASNMVEACNIPIIADCDTGFGGPGNVSHMVKKYENAGISAICIEDKTFPKKNSFLENESHDLLPEKDFVAKIIAARDAKQNNDFMIIARTEALIAGLGVKEAINRANAYETAGADALLIHSKQKNTDEIFEFTDSWQGNIPLVVVPTAFPNAKLKDLSEHKIRIVIYANQTLRSAHSSMSNILKKIKDEKLHEVENEMSSMEDIFKLQKTYSIEEKEKEIEKELKKLGYIT